MSGIEKGNPQSEEIAVPILYVGAEKTDSSTQQIVESFDKAVGEFAASKNEEERAIAKKNEDDAKWARYQNLRSEQEIANALVEVTSELSTSQAAVAEMQATLDDRGIKVEDLPEHLQKQLLSEKAHLKNTSEIVPPSERTEEETNPKESQATTLGDDKLSAEIISGEIKDELVELEKDPHIKEMLEAERKEEEKKELAEREQESEQLDKTVITCKDIWTEGKVELLGSAREYINGIVRTAVVAEANDLSYKTHGRAFDQLTTKQRTILLSQIEASYRELPQGPPTARLGRGSRAEKGLEYFRLYPEGEDDFIRKNNTPFRGDEKFDSEQWDIGKQYSQRDEDYRQRVQNTKVMNSILFFNGYSLREMFPNYNPYQRQFSDKAATVNFARHFAGVFSLANFADRIDHDHQAAGHQNNNVFRRGKPSALSELPKLMGELGFLEMDGAFVDPSLSDQDRAQFLEQLEPWRQIAQTIDNEQRQQAQDMIDQEIKQLSELAELAPKQKELDSQLSTAKDSVDEQERTLSQLRQKEEWLRTDLSSAGILSRGRVKKELAGVTDEIKQLDYWLKQEKKSVEEISEQVSKITEITYERFSKGAKTGQSPQELNSQIEDLKKIKYL